MLSKYDYDLSLKIAVGDPSFYALIASAIRKADTNNLAKLTMMWPETVKLFSERYNNPS